MIKMKMQSDQYSDPIMTIRRSRDRRAIIMMIPILYKVLYIEMGPRRMHYITCSHKCLYCRDTHFSQKDELPL